MSTVYPTQLFHHHQSYPIRSESPWNARSNKHQNVHKKISDIRQHPSSFQFKSPRFTTIHHDSPELFPNGPRFRAPGLRRRWPRRLPRPSSRTRPPRSAYSLGSLGASPARSGPGPGAEMGNGKQKTIQNAQRTQKKRWKNHCHRIINGLKKKKNELSMAIFNSNVLVYQRVWDGMGSSWNFEIFTSHKHI